MNIYVNKFCSVFVIWFVFVYLNNQNHQSKSVKFKKKNLQTWCPESSLFESVVLSFSSEADSLEPIPSSVEIAAVFNSKTVITENKMGYLKASSPRILQFRLTVVSNTRFWNWYWLWLTLQIFQSYENKLLFWSDCMSRRNPIKWIQILRIVGFTLNFFKNILDLLQRPCWINLTILKKLNIASQWHWLALIIVQIKIV